MVRILTLTKRSTQLMSVNFHLTGILKTSGSVKNLVNVVSENFPNASSWPNSVYAGFPEMAKITG